MLNVKPATVECDGTKYEMHLATVQESFLGQEDHGIFTWILTLDYGGSHQGAGTYSLNNPTNLGRHIQELCKFFGTDWNRIAGRRVFALKESHSGVVRGFMDERQTKMVFFSDWNEVVN